MKPSYVIHTDVGYVKHLKIACVVKYAIFKTSTLRIVASALKQMLRSVYIGCTVDLKCTLPSMYLNIPFRLYNRNTKNYFVEQISNVKSTSCNVLELRLRLCHPCNRCRANKDDVPLCPHLLPRLTNGKKFGETKVSLFDNSIDSRLMINLKRHEFCEELVDWLNGSRGVDLRRFLETCAESPDLLTALVKSGCYDKTFTALFCEESRIPPHVTELMLKHFTLLCVSVFCKVKLGFIVFMYEYIRENHFLIISGSNVSTFFVSLERILEVHSGALGLFLRSYKTSGVHASFEFSYGFCHGLIPGLLNLNDLPVRLTEYKLKFLRLFFQNGYPAWIIRKVIETHEEVVEDAVNNSFDLLDYVRFRCIVNEYILSILNHEILECSIIRELLRRNLTTYHQLENYYWQSEVNDLVDGKLKKFLRTEINIPADADFFKHPKRGFRYEFVNDKLENLQRLSIVTLLKTTFPVNLNNRPIGCES